MAGKLNEKQEAFCREYIIDLNATQAAIRAGYSAKTARAIGCKLLTNADIQSRIAELMKERSNRAQIDADWVLTAAKRVYDRCMQDEPVLDRKGEPVMCTTANGSVAALTFCRFKHIDPDIYSPDKADGRTPLYQ